MKKNILTILIILFFFPSKGKSYKNQYIGVNVFQLPASTINMNYYSDYNPRFTSVVDFGFSLGYNEKFDFIGGLLTPHIINFDNYLLKNQSGGYIKAGGYLNFRKGYNKFNFLHLGLFITNSIVYEEASYFSVDDTKLFPDEENIKHFVNILGLNSSIGYDFEINSRLRSNVDFQFSIPSPNYLNLYGYSNFIPGMGFKDTDKMWFPMLIFNLKYQLDKERHLRE